MAKAKGSDKSSKTTKKPAATATGSKAGTQKTASKTTGAKKAQSARTSTPSSSTKSAAAGKASKAATAPGDLEKAAKGGRANETAGATKLAEGPPVSGEKPPREAALATPPAEGAIEVTSELDGIRLPATRGKVGVFGGPRDHSAKPDDKLGLPTGRHSQYEPVRSLNARSFYCAMRWDYRQRHMSPEEGKRWWANKKLLVTNAAKGKSVIVRAVDYGPHENTGLAISVSPGAAEAIGVEVGDEVEIKFADQKDPLGPVESE